MVGVAGGEEMNAIGLRNWCGFMRILPTAQRQIPMYETAKSGKHKNVVFECRFLFLKRMRVEKM